MLSPVAPALSDRPSIVAGHADDTERRLEAGGDPDSAGGPVNPEPAEGGEAVYARRGELLDVTQRLREKGVRTLGHETNLARAPLWSARDRPVQLSLIAPTVLYGHQFRQ